MPVSDGESRQYIREAWQPYTLNCENGEILCNLNPDRVLKEMRPCA